MDKPKPGLNEGVPSQEKVSNPEEEKAERVRKILGLVERINESRESLPFPGLTPEAHGAMRADDEEFPGYTTPVDEIIERCKTEGIKVVLGKNPESGNVFVLPAGSTNIEMDSIAPHQLLIENVGDEDLLELIKLIPKKR